ncbi:MAG: hypothetical protein ACOC3C_07330 [Candidatus Thorarchaeota archaeon]
MFFDNNEGTRVNLELLVPDNSGIAKQDLKRLGEEGWETLKGFLEKEEIDSKLT